MTNLFTWKKNLKFLVLKNNRENQIFFFLRGSYREYCKLREESICYRQKGVSRLETT